MSARGFGLSMPWLAQSSQSHGLEAVMITETTHVEPSVAPLRTFFIPELHDEEGRFVIEVDGDPAYAVDVAHGTATLRRLPAGDGGLRAGPTIRASASYDSAEIVEAILSGRLHPIVAALQNRQQMPRTPNDGRFALNVLLGLRASSPTFAAGALRADRS